MENFKPEDSLENQYLPQDDETIIPESSAQEVKRSEIPKSNREVIIPGLTEAVTVEDIIESVKLFPSKIGDASDFEDLQARIRFAALSGELIQVPEEGGVRAKLKEVLLAKLQKEVGAQTDNPIGEQFSNASGVEDERSGEDSLEREDNVTF